MPYRTVVNENFSVANSQYKRCNQKGQGKGVPPSCRHDAKSLRFLLPVRSMGSQRSRAFSV